MADHGGLRKRFDERPQIRECEWIHDHGAVVERELHHHETR